MAGTGELRRLLSGTTLPSAQIEALIEEASPIWLMSAPAHVLATDVALSHPSLAPAEVRAVVHPLGDGDARLAVVSHDRPGLLADTAGVLAVAGVSVAHASVMTWPTRGLALHALTVYAPGWGEARWSVIGAELRAAGLGRRPDPAFTPTGRAEVASSPQGTGRCLVTVRAPDQRGLLWAICRWFADRGVNIEAAHVGSAGAEALGHFLVTGQPTVAELARALTGAPAVVESPRPGRAGARRRATRGHPGNH